VDITYRWNTTGEMEKYITVVVIEDYLRLIVIIEGTTTRT